MKVVCASLSRNAASLPEEFRMCVAYSGKPKDIGTFKRDAYWHLQILNRSEIIV